ncbi:MAG: glycosyltransferase [Anaerolineae bacterium]|jgi:sterol 3beta-glucosyltransferase|nr:glycosyltransferase [Anaerolineae bacterium]
MTQITIVASGSRGDVQPYVALGKGLLAAGYRVRLLASENFASLATEAGLAFASTGLSIEAITQSEEWRTVLESGNFIAILKKMQSEMKRHAADATRLLPDLLRESDLIVAGMSVLGIHGLATHYRIPMVRAYVFPFTPTRLFPTPLVPKLALGGVFNRWSYQITHQLFWQNSKAVSTELRKLLHLPKGSFWGPFTELERTQTLMLYGYSRHVLPRPNDWPDHHQVTGYWFLDEPEGWSPPGDLVEFLNQGAPPVYIGFGSMGSRNPQEAGELALAALARSGQRGVLAAGWGGLRPTDVPETVHLIGSLPHSWLFPRMAAVVHHGGAGTTAAGLRAGLPSIIVPFMGDQAFWGERVRALGVGTMPIPRKQLTADRLAQAITTAVTHAEMRQKAAALGALIRDEDGISAFVQQIKQRFPLSHKPVTLNAPVQEGMPL